MEFALQAESDFALSGAEIDAAVKEFVAAEGVEGAEELAGVVVEGFVALFELIELLEDDDGHDDVVFFEVVEAGAVVEDDVGVEDEDFFLRSRHSHLSTAGV